MWSVNNIQELRSMGLNHSLNYELKSDPTATAEAMLCLIKAGNIQSERMSMCCTLSNLCDCRIASLSKIFPTLMLYKMWEDGLVSSLDDPLEKYVDNFSIKNPLGKGGKSGSTAARTAGTKSPALTLRRMASQLSGKHEIHF